MTSRENVDGSVRRASATFFVLDLRRRELRSAVGVLFAVAVLARKVARVEPLDGGGQRVVVTVREQVLPGKPGSVRETVVPFDPAFLHAKVDYTTNGVL